VSANRLLLFSLYIGTSCVVCVVDSKLWVGKRIDWAGRVRESRGWLGCHLEGKKMAGS
jgi:hypothetical protein